jgi:hypothetical protein
VRFAPEVPDLLGTVARKRSDESIVSKEVGAGSMKLPSSASL